MQVGMLPWRHIMEIGYSNLSFDLSIYGLYLTFTNLQLYEHVKALLLLMMS